MGPVAAAVLGVQVDAPRGPLVPGRAEGSLSRREPGECRYPEVSLDAVDPQAEDIIQDVLESRGHQIAIGFGSGFDEVLVVPSRDSHHLGKARPDPWWVVQCVIDGSDHFVTRQLCSLLAFRESEFTEG